MIMFRQISMPPFGRKNGKRVKINLDKRKRIGYNAMENNNNCFALEVIVWHFHFREPPSAASPFPE